MDLLTPDEIAALRRITSPTVSNVIETFNLRPRGEGFTAGGVHCCFPELGTLVGYACTAVIMSGQPAAPRRLANRKEYWEYTKSVPGPKVTVMQDLSDPPLGAFWGEVNSNIHHALGSQGVITNGTVRDIDEVRTVGFHFFAGSVSVSHAYAHLEDFNRQVKVFGMTVKPGDLIHADAHGIVVVPMEIAREVAAAARDFEAKERVIIDLCKSVDFSISQLDKLVGPGY